MSEEDLFDLHQSSSGLAYDADNYQEKTDHQHVLERPNVYIGSTTAETILVYTAGVVEEQLKLEEESVQISEGLERIFLEVLCNAGDNALRSQAAGINPGTIKVQVGPRWIQVWNSGRTIPVVKKESLRGEMWTPTFIFGLLRTSSNYDDDQNKMIGGINGFGVKLANIFATEMVVEVGDPVNQLHFKQVWTGNMYHPEEPIITSYKKKTPFVQVSLRPDLARLGIKNTSEPLEEELTEFRRQVQRLSKLALPKQMDRQWFLSQSHQETQLGELVDRFRPHLQGHLSESILGLFFRHTLDQSLICKVPVEFNGETYNLKNIQTYAQLYFGEAKTFRVRDWPEGTKLKSNGTPEDPGAIPTLDVLLVDTPGKGKVISFANGIMTPNGGMHTEFCYAQFSKLICNHMNSKSFSGISKEKAKMLASVKVTLREVRQNLSIVVIARVPNPQWDSQSKRSLKGSVLIDSEGQQREFKLSINIPRNFTEKIKGWEMLEALENHMFGQLRGLMKKTDGTKKSKIKVDVGQDAHKAGTKDSNKCTLYLSEGNSAMGFIRILISRMEGNWDYNGALPLRGKPISVMKATLDKIAENRELAVIKEWLGLREETDYTQERWFNTLRYGHVVICADADDDGYHILMLVLSIFHKFYPSLLEIGYVSYYKTPLFMVTYKNEVHRFFNNQEFSLWQSEHKDFHMTDENTIRNKGLGGMGPKEARVEFENRRIIRLLYDQDASDGMNMLFSKDTEPRKLWLKLNWDRNQIENIYEEPDGPVQEISDVIDTSMFAFAGTALLRGIPDMSGLKRSVKQALWGLIVNYNLNDPKIKNRTLKVKKLKAIVVSDASSLAKTLTGYEHGNTSMEGTMIHMGQSFVGANNIPLFTTIGVWGSREANGTDHASSRYIKLRLAPCVPWIFRREFGPVLKFRNLENEDAVAKSEPKLIPAVVPIGLINGVKGMGLGHSTTFPMFRPSDIVGALEDLLTGKEIRNLMPYFRYFQGKINLKKRLTSEAKELLKNRPPVTASRLTSNVAEENPDEETFNTDGENLSASEDYEEYWELLGEFEWTNGTVVVTELPPYKSVTSYKEDLKKMEENKIIKGFKSNCLTGLTDKHDHPIPDKIHITIFGVPYEMANHRSLHLRQVIGTTNLKVLNDNDYPVRFKNVYHYIKVYVDQTLSWYMKRKLREISDLEKKSDKKIMRRDFIQAVLDGDLQLWKPTQGKKKSARTKTEIYQDMIELNFPEEFCPELLRTGTDKFTDEEIAKLDKQITEMEDEIVRKKAISPSQIWLDDLNDLKQECPDLMY